MKNITHQHVIDLDDNISDGRLFNYSKDSIYVKLAMKRLRDKGKTKTVEVGTFASIPNVVSEADLWMAMFEIEEQSKEAGIDLRTR